MTKIINASFKGYYFYDFNFPASCGIYCIYSTKLNSNGEYSVDRLVYIGKSSNLSTRIYNHSCTDYLAEEMFAYSYCILTDYQAMLAEAALVNTCQPRGNSNFISCYPDNYESVQVNVYGDHIFIPDTINKG